MNDGEPDDTDLQSLRDADYTDRQKQQTKEPATSSSTQPASTPSWTLQSQNEPSQSGEDAQPPRRSKPKRHRSDENTEAQADQAATEIVELVEKETTNLLTHWRATQHSPATLQLPDTDVSDIPEHILAESRELSKEVTPPGHLFFRDAGERQDGDCGPLAVIGALYYVYCQTGLKRKALESLLTYGAIRQFTTTHLQHRTLLSQAQIDTTRSDGWQVELNRATQDLCAQIPQWNSHLDPYAPESTWIWERIAHTESQTENRQAVWWSDTMVALVLKAALGSIPPDSATQAHALRAKQILTAVAGEGTLDIALLNAEHGIMVIEDLVLQQTWMQEQCEHFKIIIVISRGKHFITYFRHSSLLSGSREWDGVI